MAVYSARAINLESVGPILDLTILPIPAAIQAMSKAGSPAPNPVQASALIDTGATCTVIRENIAAELGLKPIGSTTITTASTPHRCNRYIVAFTLPPPTSGSQTPITLQLPVIAAPLTSQNIQCLLGRDFLKHAILVYNGPQDSFDVAI